MDGLANQEWQGHTHRLPFVCWIGHAFSRQAQADGVYALTHRVCVFFCYVYICTCVFCRGVFVYVCMRVCGCWCIHTECNNSAKCFNNRSKIVPSLTTRLGQLPVAKRFLALMIRGGEPRTSTTDMEFAMCSTPARWDLILRLGFLLYQDYYHHYYLALPPSQSVWSETCVAFSRFWGVHILCEFSTFACIF
jgi:hypothetical protein